MSPIIDIQRRLAQVGRIRIGEQVASGNAKRPKKLEMFRLTSPNKRAMDQLAEVYGGEVHPWEDAPTGTQWELFTKSLELSVLVPPEGMSFSQFYEVWSGGGCRVRCDGQWDSINDQACSCSSDPEERLCKPHTRLSVMIQEVAASGMWRLDTSGYYAATEIGGAFDLGQLISQATGQKLLRATLRLDQREVKRPDKPPHKFAVPVLQFEDVSVFSQPALTTGLTPLQPPDSPSVASQLEAMNQPRQRSTRANAAEPVRPTGVGAPARGPMVGDDDEEPTRLPPSNADGPASDEACAQYNSMLALVSQSPKDNHEFLQALKAAGQPLDRGPETVSEVAKAIELMDAILNRVEDDPNPQPEGAIHVKPDDILPPLVTSTKVTRLHILFGDLGIARQDRYAYAGRVVKADRVITSLKQLFKSEAEQLEAQLVADIAAKS